MGFRKWVAKALAPPGVSLEREGRAVRKQETDRRATLPPQILRLIKRHDALPKPYDPLTLRDLSDNPIAQAYIDTMAQDTATAEWTLGPKNESVTVSDGELDDARERVMNLHPEMSFRDLREFFARDMLELGDGVLVKHFDTNGELAEAVPLDSSRVFKKIDEHGFLEGYLQTSFSERTVEVEYDSNELVWSSWAPGGRENFFYGYGPTEKGEPIIDLLDELADKELKDLKEGAPPGIVHAQDSVDNPIPPEEFKRVDSQWELREGQRHRHIVSRGGWDFTALTPGYQELQLLERSKFWVHSLGAVFKVNAPYAGFDFQEGNKAQNVAQAEAYRQRGFRVLLRYIEQAFNHQLLPDIDDRLKFTFEIARTVEEQKQSAELIEAQANAGSAMVGAGRPVTFRDGALVVEEGEMEENQSDSSDLFGEAGGVQFGVTTKSVSELPFEDALELDEHLYRAHEEQIQPEKLSDIEKRTWTEDESVPEFVKDAIHEAIEDGAVFSQFESVPGEVRDRLEGLLEEKLTQPQGWSLDSIVNDMEEMFPGVSTDALETVARTETGAVMNTAREKGYEDRDRAATMKFKWSGGIDSRTTDACKWLIGGEGLAGDGPSFSGTDPKHGGTPLSMPDLKRVEREAVQYFFPDLTFRDDHIPHPNCRKTFTRVVEV